jgi:hypothetical protein
MGVFLVPAAVVVFAPLPVPLPLPLPAFFILEALPKEVPNFVELGVLSFPLLALINFTGFPRLLPDEAFKFNFANISSSY